MNHTTSSNDSIHLLMQTLQKIEGAYAPSTLRAYRADFEEFITYSDSVGENALPAPVDAVVSFIQHLVSRGQKSASIRRSIAGIASIHQLSSLPDPTKDVEVKLAIRRMHRQLGREQHQALAITQPLLKKLLAATDDGLRDARDRALISVAYDTLCRRSELLSLRVEDIHLNDVTSEAANGGASIFLRKSKTDQEAHGRWLHISEGTKIYLQAWLNASEIKEGLLFRGVNRGNRLTNKLDISQLARVYKKLARQANFDEKLVREISGHSTRVGAAQDLLLSGASLPIIMNRGRWSKPDTVMRYVEKIGAPI
jgi:site-specific recombinase XerD